MPRIVKMWDQGTVSVLREDGWQLIEADLWASKDGRRFRILFRDGTMTGGFFPGKEPGPRKRKGNNVGALTDQGT